MNPNPEHEEDLFARALSLPPAERRAFVERACAANLALQCRVLALLAADAAATGFLAPAVEAGVPRAAATEEQPGEQIDRYKLLQKIGEGGCGTVWMAEQTEPLQRRVALKVIKLGMDTKEVIARFESERQALALMDHPNIARVYDAGTTSSGRPYFVMELVRGPKITAYCDEHALPTAERVALFIAVCHAVQHAHQKGVIHRDLKPSNILVTQQDGAPTPKVIDFGIAKATQGRLTDSTLFTAFEQFVGTPAYMSPEQAELSNQDVDTRSDVYSLGVLLYELLTGHPPFDPQTLLQAGLDEMRRLIREVDPPRPSARLRTLENNTLTTAAHHRATQPPRLIHLLRGDLDWIAMRCLEKDRRRRYPTADELAQDLDRHLRDEPVAARPPGTLYLWSKLARRHRAACTAGATVAIALVLATAVSLLSAHRARLAETEASHRAEAERVARAEADAQRQLADARLQAELTARKEAEAQHDLAEQRLAAERAAREDATRHQAKAAAEGRRAQAETQRSAEVGRLMKQMLSSVGPEVALGRDTALLHSVLDATSARLGRELQGQPAVAADLLHVTGTVYSAIGDKAAAVRVLTESIERLRASGAGAADLVLPLVDLAEAETAAGQLDPAAGTLDEALALGRAQYGAEHPDIATIFLAQSRVALARFTLLLTQPRGDRPGPTDKDTFDHAEKLAQEALAMRRRLLGERQPAVADALEQLARIQLLPVQISHGLMFSGGDSEAARPITALLRQALAIRRVAYGSDHPVVVNTLSLLGTALMESDDDVEAEQVLREALAAQRRLLGPEHPALLQTLDSLFRCVRARGGKAEVTPLLEESVAIRRRVYGGSSRELLEGLDTLWYHHLTDGDYAAAEPAAREWLEVARRVGGPDHPELAALHALASTLEHRANFAAAEPLRRELVELAHSTKAAPPALGGALVDLALNLRVQGALAAAEHSAREGTKVLRDWTKVAPATDQQQAWVSLGDALLALGAIEYDQRLLPSAAATFAEVVTIRRERIHDKDDAFGLTVPLLWTALVAQEDGDRRAAEAQFRALRGRGGFTLYPQPHPALVRGLIRVAELARKHDDWAEAEKILSAAWRALEESPWMGDSVRRETAKGFLALYDDWARTDRSKAALAAEWNRRVPPEKQAEPSALDFLHDGATTRQDVLERFGEPASQLPGGIVCYRLRGTAERGYRVAPARLVASLADDHEVGFSLVLTFDEKGVLQRHALVSVR